MASALENFVNNVRTLSASGKYRELTEHLGDSIDLLTKNWSILDNVLETLDIQQHSLGVLYVLIAKFNSLAISNADGPQLMQQFEKFINLCNGEQVRFATHAFYELCHLYTSHVVDQPLCLRGIKILATAIEKIRLFDTQLTAVHADLCQLSLKAKSFRIALQFLDVDITSISTASETGAAVQNQTTQAAAAADANYDSKFVLLYYYYGGMIYTAVKNYERALFFFEVCISTPAMALSLIMLEAYKKFILVSLIVHGRLLPLPKHSSQAIARYMKPMAQIYLDLVTAFATKKSDELRLVINKYSEHYTRDCNFGLVKQVVEAFYKKNIKRLTKTFLTLSLTDVANRVQLPNAAAAEKYILKMINNGEIHAEINQKENMITFKDDPEMFDSSDVFLELQEDLISVTDLVVQINKMEEEIMLNPAYIKKASSNVQEDDLSAPHPKAFTSDPME